ncbi:MAG: Glycosyl transferase, family 4, conserved region [Candidatus Gallionella acididurans]|jgi:UDP-N-acetylmuramyl pentapeptide phosphotransferase/UDP-N-acetylglucosamine-1-phosphate transferase|uniref:Glycosyl transferase, family 4, conserved region n=1 Tax=Candidatus Gallionella acididurans TaxID=1796491 RepID=A0A139BX33_9PROT|nr:MAG: Glycosyl transferase, family 4, conserved region [Candidatus Gallionella acididurans]
MTHYPPIISAFVTMMLTLLLTLNKNGMIQDIPNERSLHTEPIPRVGGIAIMAGILSGWILLFHFWEWWIVLPVLGLFMLSLVDDVRNLSAKIRLLGHFVAAVIVVAGAGVQWLWLLPILLFIVWMTNLFNFMDGADGLAAGMALFGFSFYGVAGLMHGNEAFAMMNFTIGAAALGFLYHNFYPARVFMGDAGSIPLGFLAAAFGVWGWQQGYWPFWFPVLVFSPFVIDASATLLKRTRRREKLTEAHRDHYYQRLIRMGWGHRNTAVAEYMLMLAAGGSALWGIGLDAQEQGNLLAWWGAVYLGLATWVDRRWRQHEVMKKSAAEI